MVFAVIISAQLIATIVIFVLERGQYPLCNKNYYEETIEHYESVGDKYWLSMVMLIVHLTVDLFQALFDIILSKVGNNGGIVR